MKLSIVATLYKSEPYIDEFYRRVRTAAEQVFDDFEIVFVNDGSPDASLDRAVFLSRNDPRVVVVDLSRNFGHHKAIMTGLEVARGDFVFLIDTDLEEPPEILEQFYREICTQKCDVVYGRNNREKRGLAKLTAILFYKVLNGLSDISIPPDATTARLMTHRYVRDLLRFRERVIFIDGLWASTGYKQVGVLVQKSFKGATSYNTWMRLSLAADSITSFSARPLVLIALLGAAISILAGCVCVYLFISWLTRYLLVGWLSLIASIWLLGGLSILSVGITGLYISRIFVEVKQRPYTIIRDIFRNGSVVACYGADEHVRNPGPSGISAMDVPNGGADGD